jgi:hypothetical protein
MKKRKRDIAESDFVHQNESRKSYLAYIRTHINAVKVTCTKSGKLLDPGKIGGKVWEKVKPLL